jgi:hypothetical protein
MNESEEDDVVSWDLGSSHGHCHFNFLVRLNWVCDGLGLFLQVVTVSLEEFGVLGPLFLTDVSEGPCLGEGIACVYWESITEAFLDESSLVVNSPFTWLFVASSWSALALRLRARYSRCTALIDILVHVRARDESWGMVRLSDFQEGVSVGFLGFAFLAEVKVRADTALIANACHGNY